MIKEKDVEKCKFFTTTGGDIWRTKKVRLITEIELVNCETGKTQTCRINEQSAERFIAIDIPRIKRTEDRSQKSEVRKRKPKTGTAVRNAKNKRGCTKGKPPSSQYFGVTVHQQKSGPSYYAQCHRGGKFKGLGVHKVEELAAAAVQEHIGNIEEAERLRKMAEQKTALAISELKGQAAQLRFLCSGCGADYEKKPDKCGKCGGGSFEKIWRN